MRVLSGGLAAATVSGDYLLSPDGAAEHGAFSISGIDIGIEGIVQTFRQAALPGIVNQPQF